MSDLKYRLSTLTRIMIMGGKENVVKKAVAEDKISGSFWFSKTYASRKITGIRFRTSIIMAKVNMNDKMQSTN